MCPRDFSPLAAGPEGLRCERGHEYPVVDGIPILLIPDVEQTHTFAQRSLEVAANDSLSWVRSNRWELPSSKGVHPYVQEMVGKTNGILYQHLQGALSEYPIPELPMADGDGMLLDIGCSWGRWSIAAAQKGYRVTGIDPDIYGVMAARDVARQLGVAATFIVADARHLPFPDLSFDSCFSFSVLQHLSKPDALAAIAQIGRVLRKSGSGVVQMPNQNGLRAIFHRAKRGFSEGAHFQVRYWSPKELTSAFEELIGPAELEVAGFFGLGSQASDLRFMPARYRAIIKMSEILRSVSSGFPPLRHLADSLYVRSVKL